MTPLPSITNPDPRSASSGDRGAAFVRKDASTTEASHARELEKIQRAAKDFEAVFLRQMLSALERTTKVGDRGSNVAGQRAYGSMIVEAVADAVAQAGGIGLSDLLARVLVERTGQTAGNAVSTPVADAPSPANPAQSVLIDPAASAPTHLAQVAPSSSETSTSSSTVASTSAALEKSPQGSSPTAVPWTETRTFNALSVGQLADRRIR